MQSYKFSFKTTSVNFNDYKGDLSKKWYIDFGYCIVGKRKRYKRLWVPFVPNHQSRYDSAKKLIDKINIQIEANLLPEQKTKPTEQKSKFIEELEIANAIIVIRVPIIEIILIGVLSLGEKLK